MRRPLPVRDVLTALENNIDRLVREIFPRGRREGAEYRVGSIAGEPGSSLAVHLGPDKPGIWCDFAIGLGGNVLDLIADVLFGGDKRRALAWALAWLAARGSAGAPSDHFRHRGGHCSDGQRNAEARSRAALKIFMSGTDRLVGTPGERYLRSRGIDLDSLPRPPSSLRFHPCLWNTESRRHWPALMAAITTIEGHRVGVHRTFLESDGSGKAPLESPKKSLGPYRGASVELSRGSSNRPLKDAPAGDTVVIGEGLEDSLTAVLAAPEYRVLCAVSLSNLAAVELPETITTVVILGQNDPPESAAARTLRRAVGAFQAQGRTVKIARPPSTYKDFNDVARRAPR
jgi:hypothetical protein